MLLLLTQALEKLPDAALASRESKNKKNYDYKAPPWCGNADLRANASVHMEQADVKSIPRHGYSPGNLVGCFHCPSSCSSASSFSSSPRSISIHPKASQPSNCATSSRSRGKPKPPPTSPKDDRHFNVSNGVQLSNFSQNHRDGSDGTGCFHNLRKKNDNKLGGFLFSYQLSFFDFFYLISFVFIPFISWIFICLHGLPHHHHHHHHIL